LAHECLQLNEELQGLRADNDQLAQYAKAAPTPEGRELLARGRYNMVKQGEWLAVIDEVPQPTLAKPTGVRAVIGNIHATLSDDLKSLRELHKLMSHSRSSKASGS
jgi:hypothetical protein